MLCLTLMRHAHAPYPHIKYDEVDQVFSDDLGRALSVEGIEQATAAGAVLQSPQLILTSPSIRTMQTLECLLKGWHDVRIITEDIIYHGAMEQLLELLQLCDVYEVENIMLLGHNPTISELSFTLQDSGVTEFEVMAPAESHVLEFDCDSWALLRPSMAARVG